MRRQKDFFWEKTGILLQTWDYDIENDLVSKHVSCEGEENMSSGETSELCKIFIQLEWVCEKWG